jgi:hypothetical protein
MQLHNCHKYTRPSRTASLTPVLFHRQVRHKTGCVKCAKGGGHTVWVLSVAYTGGITRQFSIRPEMKPQVEQWLRNYEKLQARLEQIC